MTEHNSTRNQGSTTDVEREEANHSLSRRKALRVLGTIGAASLTSPGLGAANGRYNWHAAVVFPLLTKMERGEPRVVEATELNGVVNGESDDDRAAIIPNHTKGADCWFGGIRCDSYRAHIPYHVVWSCDSDSVGADIYIRSSPDNRSSSTRGWGESHRVSGDGDRQSGTLTPKLGQLSHPAPNHFRPVTFELVVDFRNSRINERRQMATMEAILPNHSYLSSAESVIEMSDTVYDEGADLASQATRWPVDHLRRFARFYAYAGSVSSGAVSLDDELPRDAAVEGIAGFTTLIENHQEREFWDVDATISMFGPTAMTLDN